MRPRFLLAIALSLLPLSSCLCLDLLEFLANPPVMPDLPDAGLNEVPPNSVVISEDDVDWVQSCMFGSPDADALLDAAFEAFEAFDDGTLEVELSDDRCLRFSRTMAGGQLQAARFYRFTGETDVVYGGDDVQYVAFVRNQAVWERLESGVLRGQVHDDSVAPLRGAESPWEVEILEDVANRRRTTTRFDANGEVQWRITTQGSADGTTQTVERLVDGALVTETTIVGDENRAQGDPCMAQGGTCDQATIDALDAAMKEALKRGTKCMRQLNDGSRDDTWMRYVMLQQRWTQGHRWRCLPANCTNAQWCDTCQDSGEPLTIEIGAVEWQAFHGRDAIGATGVLFHELMHGVIGYHPDTIVNSDVYRELNRRDKLMRRYTDRVNSCQAYCFYPEGVTPTKCSCAACLDTTVCDDRCSGLESCIEYENGVAIMSEAIGTACIKYDPELNGHGEETATWFSQKADCDASDCASTGGRCESKSVSCDEGCE